MQRIERDGKPLQRCSALNNDALNLNQARQALFQNHPSLGRRFIELPMQLCVLVIAIGAFTTVLFEGAETNDQLRQVVGALAYDRAGQPGHP